LQLKKNETCLVVTDTLQSKIAKKFYKTASSLCRKAVYVEMTPRKRSGQEPPKKVAELLKQCDVALLITSKSLTHTKARRAATKRGVRMASMPGITEEMIKRAIPIDYYALQERNRRLLKALQGHKKIEITTRLGTKLAIGFEDRIWGGARGGFIMKKGKYGNLPEGEVYAAPQDKTANGVWFVDVIPGVGKVKNPIKITVKDGVAVNMTGKYANKIKKIFKGLPKKAFVLAELGIGTNPKAKITGNILEDEKVLGTAHIALGNNMSMGGKNNVSIHLDLVFTKPTIVVDGKTIMEEGKLKV
jgi:leucyl aminopeptidase (aminopeptidase T)